MAERLQRLDSIDPFVGRYYSLDWVRKNVLMQTEEEIAEIDKQMEKEEAAGLYDTGDVDEFGNPIQDGEQDNKSSTNPKAKDDNDIQHTLNISLKKAK